MMSVTDLERKPIRVITRGAYDLQKLRIQTGNRVVGNFRAKLGQAPGERAEDSLDEDAKQLLADLKRRHRRITDAIIGPRKRKRKKAGVTEYDDATGDETTGVAERAAGSETPEVVERTAFPGDEVISTFTEYALVSEYIDLEQVERENFKRLAIALEEVPIYTQFLKGVVGIGPAMAGVIVSEFDIHRAKYPSSLWAYAGLDVASDGLGRSKRKEHLVKRQYKNAKGEDAERDSITYNPWLKTKLMGVLGPSFLRSASPYADIYRQYRHRLESDPRKTIKDTPGFSKEGEWSKMRRHQAAMRYMVKMFLIDLYKKWREIEGLPVAPPYHEAKLGLHHRAA